MSRRAMIALHIPGTPEDQQAASMQWLRAMRDQGALRAGHVQVILSGVLASTYVDPDTGIGAFPGIRRLAADVRAHPRSITRALAALRDEGWIHRYTHTTGGDR